MNNSTGLLPFMDILMGLVGIVILINLILALNLSESETVAVRILPKEMARSDRENWQPVYVVCNADGLSVRGVLWEIPMGDSRQEQFKSLIRKEISEIGKGAYVLALIRPSGYGSFSRLRALLDEMAVKIGYEPINEDWRIQKK